MENFNFTFNTTKLINQANLSSLSSSSSSSAIRSWDIWETLLLILLLFALIGNTLTILIMRSKKMRSSNTALFLTSLAFADIFVLSSKFLFNMQKLYKIPVYSFCIVVYVLPDIAALTSYWLIIITTIERTIAVWFPLKVSSIITRKRCFIMIFLLITIATCITSTQVICLKSIPETPYYCGIKGKSNGKCRYYIRNVYPWIKSAFMSLIPSILGILLNSLIIISLSKASKEREIITKSLSIKNNSKQKISIELNDESITDINQTVSLVDGNKVKNKKNIEKISKERQITIMLTTVSITFVLFTLPYAIFELTRKLNPNAEFFKNRSRHRAVLFFIDCLHSTNFILYCLTGKKFRDELKNIFKCSKSGR